MIMNRKFMHLLFGECGHFVLPPLTISNCVLKWVAKFYTKSHTTEHTNEYKRQQASPVCFYRHASKFKWGFQLLTWHLLCSTSFDSVYFQHLFYTHHTNGVRVSHIRILYMASELYKQASTNTSMKHASKHSWFTLSAFDSYITCFCFFFSLFKLYYCDLYSTHFGMFRHQLRWMRVHASSSSSSSWYSSFQENEIIWCNENLSGKKETCVVSVLAWIDSRS